LADGGRHINLSELFLHVKVVSDIEQIEKRPWLVRRGAYMQGKIEAVRILIAEDEALIALSLADFLEAEGYEVHIASDGAEALVEVQRQQDGLASEKWRGPEDARGPP
jgi:PleD family two-component response regulator